MYNEALKNQFIKDDCTNKNFDKFMARYFETAAKYEEEYNKDLCNFNIQEIENYFLGLSTSSIDRCQNIKAQFIKYCQYCQERNLIDDNQIHWQEVDSEFLRRTLNIGKLNEQLITRKKLLSDLNQLNNASDMFIILGIFEGLCGNLYKDFYHLDIKQFKKKSNKIILKLEDKELEVSDKLYELACESADTYERIPNFIDAKKNNKLNPEDPWVLKRSINSRFDNINNHMHNLCKRIASIKKDFEFPYCTQAGLMNSGRLYYMYKLSENNKIEPEQVLKKNFDKITERYGRIQVKGTIIKQYKQLYMEE